METAAQTPRPTVHAADSIDHVRRQWSEIFPELDTTPVDVVGRINRLSQIIQLRSDAVLARHGITRAEFDMISLLARTGRPMTPTELATELLISGPGATKRIRKLIDAGLVEREANPLDGRGALVRLAPAATARLKPILAAVLQFEASLLATLGATTTGDLTQNLRVLLASLEPTGTGAIDTP